VTDAVITGSTGLIGAEAATPFGFAAPTKALPQEVLN
jgi:hypothetical protein